MKIIYASLIGAAIGLIVMSIFTLHDLIWQKKMKPIVEKAKQDKLKELNANPKKKVKKITDKDIDVSIHDHDISQPVYNVFGGGTMACAILVIATVLVELLTGLHWWC